MEAHVKRRSAAILAMDAVGYSHAVATDEGLALTALANSRRVIDRTIAEHGGRIFNTAGDSVLAEFSEPQAAVACARQVQDALRRARGDGPNLAFRAGIALGDVTPDGENLLGATVNVAARLEAIAPAGGICISDAVHAAITDGEAWQDLGLRHLKNLLKPVHVFRHLPEGQGALPVLAEARKPLVIVLPFASPGGNAEQSYLGEGMTEDVIAGLSRFRRLAVLGSASSNAYRDRPADLPDLVARLGIDYAVQGSVRRLGETMRLSSQLIDARTGLALWADRYDRAADDLFAAQDEIATTIVSTLAGQLDDEAAEMAARKRTENMGAYDFLLRGVHAARALDPGSAAMALATFEKALALDPDYPLALAWCALMRLRLSTWDTGASHLDAALSLARRALALDPSESWCHLVYGQVAMYRRAFAEAEQHHQRAYELNPYDAHVIALRAPLAIYLGKPEEGETWARRAMQLNPHHPDWYVTNLGLALYCLGRYAEAVAVYSKVAAPQIGILAMLAASQALTRDREAAAAVRSRLLALAPAFSARRFVESRPFRDARQPAEVLEGLKAAGLPD